MRVRKWHALKSVICSRPSYTSDCPLCVTHISFTIRKWSSNKIKFSKKKRTYLVWNWYSGYYRNKIFTSLFFSFSFYKSFPFPPWFSNECSQIFLSRLSKMYFYRDVYIFKNVAILLLSTFFIIVLCTDFVRKTNRSGEFLLFSAFILDFSF